MDSPLLSGISLVATIIGVLTGVLAILLFFRQRQFSRPNLQLIIGWDSPSHEIPRKLRKLPLSFVVMAPARSLNEPLIVYLPFCFKNPGRETVRNVRVSLEYPSDYLITNTVFESLADFKPTIVPDIGKADHVGLLKPQFTPEQLQEMLKVREVVEFDGRAQVTFEIPLIRPGEWLIMYELLRLPGLGPHSIEKLGFGSPGFNHVLDQMRKIPSVLDYLVVNLFVYAENHKRLNRKVSVIRFTSEADADRDMLKVGNTFWFGKLPPPGLYYTDRFYRWLGYKLGWIGRAGMSVSRRELGLMLFPKVATIETKTGKKYKKELPARARQQYFALTMPNCDYFAFPPQVNDSDSLLKWLGLGKPLIAHDAKKPVDTEKA